MVSRSDSLTQISGPLLPIPTEKHLERQVKTALKRARQRGLSATLTLEEWSKTMLDFQSTCAYCPDPATTIDRFLPLACQGGSDVDFSRVRFQQEGFPPHLCWIHWM